MPDTYTPLPTESVRLQYYQDSERVKHIVAIAKGATYHVCSSWCNKKILQEA